MKTFEWLLSPQALWLRLAIGGAFFVALAAWDVWHHGRAARRPREYLFLLACMALAIVYGVLNDQVTVSISWEYFYWGKGLATSVPQPSPGQAPDMAAMRLGAIEIGVVSTWWTGLLLGAALLIANNPKPSRPALPWRKLYSKMPIVMLIAAGCGTAVGLVGYMGWLSPLFPELIRDQLWRPTRFMAVWGVHLGGYLGGAIGGVWAVISTLRQRKRMASAISSSLGPER